MQLAVDTASRAVVGVEVTNAGSDAGLAEPMREQIQELRPVRDVGEQLLDGGYVRLEDLDRAAASDPPVTLTCRSRGPASGTPTRIGRRKGTARR